MKVSIIYVNFKSARLIRKSIQSLKNIETPCEIIVVDNSSSFIANNLSNNRRLKIISTDKNYGFAKACNIGAQISSGEYLFFLNPDTYIFNNAIDNLVDILKQDPLAAAVSPRMWWDQEQTLLLPPPDSHTIIDWAHYQLAHKKPHYNLFLKRYIKEIINYWRTDRLTQMKTLSGAALMMKKEIFYTIGKFDDNFELYFEDTDISRRLIDSGYKLYHVPGAEIAHFHNQSAKLVKKKAKSLFEQSMQVYIKKHHPHYSGRYFDSINRYISSLKDGIPKHTLLKIKEAPVFSANCSGDVLFLFSVNHFFHPSAGAFLRNPQFTLNKAIWNRLQKGTYWAGFFNYPEIEPIKIWQIHKL
jgi:GT2 family glycosyltransferase